MPLPPRLRKVALPCSIERESLQCDDVAITFRCPVSRSWDDGRLVTLPLASSVILMCGLPASGKTTTAGRLHRALGGVLIRSCDVYADLGISLPDWVRRTGRFTRHARAYEIERDRAYVEMARRLEAALVAPARPVIVDAVHGEREKRRMMYEITWRHHETPVLLWCRCDSIREVHRRFATRQGRDAVREHEAADLSVFPSRRESLGGSARRRRGRRRRARTRRLRHPR